MWLTTALHLFWTIWQERNLRAFECVEKLEQLLKSFFICNFWVYVMHCIGETPMPMLDFVD